MVRNSTTGAGSAMVARSFAACAGADAIPVSRTPAQPTAASRRASQFFNIPSPSALLREFHRKEWIVGFELVFRLHEAGGDVHALGIGKLLGCRRRRLRRHIAHGLVRGLQIRVVDIWETLLEDRQAFRRVVMDEIRRQLHRMPHLGADRSMLLAEIGTVMTMTEPIGSKSFGSPCTPSATTTPLPSVTTCSTKGGPPAKPSIEWRLKAARVSAGCIGETVTEAGSTPPCLATTFTIESTTEPTASMPMVLPCRIFARSASGAFGLKCAASATSLRITTFWPL